MSSNNDNPIAASPLARTALELGAQGNIRISKSGMNLSGQNNPASPNPKPSCTTRHTPKVFTVEFPEEKFSLD